MAQRFNFPRQQVFSDLGAIGAGYKLYTYETGTTTPLATYSDTALSSANANPTIADSAGRFGAIFVNDLRLYKAVLKDADDNTIWTADPVDPKVFSLSDFDPRPTSFWGATAGTASAYTLDANPDVAAYSSTQTFYFEAHLDNNADATMAVDGLTALTLKKYDGTGSKVNLEAGDIQAGQTYSARNDGTDIVILLTDPSTTTRRGISYLNKPVTIANNATDPNNDIDFSAGVMNFSDGSGQAVATALTKQLDAPWTAGNNAGGLFSGTKANSTWYYCFIIYNPTTNVYDAGFDSDPDVANIPSGYTLSEYRGAFFTDSSGNINLFTVLGNYFDYTYAPLDIDVIVPTTQGTQAISVPRKNNILANVTLKSFNPTSTTNGLWIAVDKKNSLTSGISLSNCDLSCDSNDNIISSSFNQKLIRIIDNTGEISYKANSNPGDVRLYVTTNGYYDYNIKL